MGLIMGLIMEHGWRCEAGSLSRQLPAVHCQPGRDASVPRMQDLQSPDEIGA
jgi:hypothetical protein